MRRALFLLASLVLGGCADDRAQPARSDAEAGLANLNLEELGPVEWPGPALREPLPWLALSLGGLVVAAAFVALVVSRTRRAEVVEEPPPAPAPAPPPEDAALRRLRALRDGDPEDSAADGAAVLAFHVEAAALLRDYLGERYAVRSTEMTTEELAAALPEGRGAAAGAPLRDCDVVKFARLRPGRDERVRLLDAVERCVRESAS